MIQRRTPRLIFIAGLVSLSHFLFAQGEAVKLDQLFNGFSNATPGVAVAVKIGDSVVYRKGFGLADLEHNVPLTPETVLESGSVAKQFTAFSILLLASEGKLSLADDVRRYVPEIPQYTTPITLQMLLNHTSGLKDWGSVGALTGWPRTTRVHDQDLALEIMSRQQGTNFTPGTEYLYSNSNYSLLVTIVERVSGMPLADFTSKRIFTPLQMAHTKWRDNFREVVPNRGIAYQFVKGNYEQLMPFENIHGHGGLLTTVDDLLKWNSLLETHAIGGDAVFQERIRRGRLANGRTITYAAGLQVTTLNGYREIAHSGSTAGYKAWLAYYPERKLSVAILSNDATFSPASTGRDVANIFLHAERQSVITQPAIHVSSDVVKRFEGYFRSTRHFDVHHFSSNRDTLFVDADRADFVATDTVRAGAGKWYYVRPGRLMLHSDGDTLSFVRVDAPRVDKDIAGIYRSVEVGADYRFYFEGNVLKLKLGHWPAKTLTPVFRDAYTDGEGVLFEFRRSKKGKPESVKVSVSRAENLVFERLSSPPASGKAK